MLDKALITVCFVIPTHITHDNSRSMIMAGDRTKRRGYFVMIMSGEDVHRRGSPVMAT
jgi:hypothetical protein